ncbi:MAG: nuclear transport factor 2 family protein [Bacteroidota bacterium]
MKNLLPLLLLGVSLHLSAQDIDTVEYYRHLRYNHISPCIDLVGIHPISEEEAQHTSHYVFKKDDAGRTLEILNNHYHTEQQHPLTSIGAFRVLFEFPKGKEVRTFYDPNGQRIKNDRQVYKEEYLIDAFGRKTALNFFNLEDRPMASNWGIASYNWQYPEEIIVERRFDLTGEPVRLSPEFNFKTTGIVLDQNGIPKVHCNLDGQFRIRENKQGIASYHDRYDEMGNHLGYSCYDASNQLSSNLQGFAVEDKEYDEWGNLIKRIHKDVDGEIIDKRSVYSNSKITLSSPASAEDSAEVKRVALGYLLALQQLDPQLMEEVMNDSLNKVTIGYNQDMGIEIARPITRKQMILLAHHGNKANNKFPPRPNNEVEILDIYNRIACVKLVSDNWVEYLHLIRLDGKWDIINLIWQYKDVDWYQKQ